MRPKVHSILPPNQSYWRCARSVIRNELSGKIRFKDLQDNIEKITPRMLSKELKELEVNGIVERKVYDSTPVRIEYHLTESGRKITKVLDAMLDWGLEHREEL
jgi:DNA-binding HxlR family transcriptional regulator